MSDPVRAYQALYGQVKRLADEYSRLPATEPTNARQEGGYGLSIKGVSSDGTVTVPSGVAFAGKLEILMSHHMSGCLEAALDYVNDPSAVSQWGYTQAYNLYNICQVYGFAYTGPGNNGSGGINVPPHGWIPPS